ncbi:hypothetical protein ACFPOA_01860 [Lysobacter niabensis]|uniref:hypothetical protein n=1 Tax=Agrilutibacter niabensis TaxID=380628 RepID=UPI00360D9AD1
MANKVRFSDRLRDRGFVDQWGFLSFAIVGFAAIFSAKRLGAEATWTAVGAGVAMLGYAFIIARAGSGRLRADQAGDNCYYLGLIYTLASLSYAIWTFDPNDPATTIVQGFGIALATTILGLILRVFFNQGRPDLENVEEQTRLEMTDAVIRLRAELGEVVRQLNDFGRVVTQSMTELSASTTASIQGLASNTAKDLQSVVEVASATIRDEANDFAARSKRYSTSFDKLLTKLEQHAEAVDQMREAHAVVRASAQAAELAVASAGTALSAMAGHADSAKSAASSVKEAAASMHGVVAGLSESVGRVQLSLQGMHEESSRRFDELRSGPGKSVVEAVGVLSGAAEALRGHLAEVSSLHSAVHANIAAQNEAALESSKQLNVRLEAELTRSREMVVKVHSSLVDMTARLADAVEPV